MYMSPRIYVHVSLLLVGGEGGGGDPKGEPSWQQWANQLETTTSDHAGKSVLSPLWPNDLLPILRGPKHHDGIYREQEMLWDYLPSLWEGVANTTHTIRIEKNLSQFYPTRWRRGWRRGDWRKRAQLTAISKSTYANASFLVLSANITNTIRIEMLGIILNSQFFDCNRQHKVFHRLTQKLA